MARKVTIFKSITVTDTPYTVSVDDIISRLKTGKHEDLINSIREEQDKDKRNALKKELPAILLEWDIHRAKGFGYCRAQWVSMLGL